MHPSPIPQSWMLHQIYLRDKGQLVTHKRREERMFIVDDNMVKFVFFVNGQKACPMSKMVKTNQTHEDAKVLDDKTRQVMCGLISNFKGMG